MRVIRVLFCLVGGTVGVVVAFILAAAFCSLLGVGESLPTREFDFGFVCGIAVGCGWVLGFDVGAKVAPR